MFNFKAVYSPPCKHEIWCCQKANIEHIGKAISGFQQEKPFQNMNFNDMFHLFNRTIKSILHNFILHEIITCDDRDPLQIDNLIRH